MIGATKNGFLSRNLITASQAASQLKLHGEEFVMKLLDRRWTLEIPDSKIHQIGFSVKQTQPREGMFGNTNFSIEKCPTLGDAAMGERCKDPSFYIVRDDLLHPLVNAVSCAERGLRSHLLLRGEEPEILTGYTLISSLYGNVVYVPRSLYAKREEMLLRHANIVAGANGSVLWFTDILGNLAGLFEGRACMQTNAIRSSKDGMKKVVIINEGAGDLVALLGVIRLVHYLAQSHVLGRERPYNFVIDAGTGTTAIGFALGVQMLGLPWKVTSVMLADTVDQYRAQEQKLISDFKQYYAADIMDTLREDELVEWVDRVSPRKFGKVLDGELKACQQVANQTGVLVDPIYTLAAWELAVHLSQREHKDDRKVVMLHTGGTLGMFGLAQRFNSYFSKLKDSQPSEICKNTGSM